MNDIVQHLLLFLAVGVAIVTLGAFYTDALDQRAFRALPKRLVTFFGGCLLLVAILLICEHTFASLS
ncbi:MAG: hypothetical protein IT454_23595 [Planctomycetes bacterium]|nr:hypothetical protein [Planctomycetota bacterium]